MTISRGARPTNGAPAGPRRRNVRRLAVLLAAVALVWSPPAAAVTAVGDCVPGTSWGVTNAAFASRVVDLVNQHRTAMGLRALKVSRTLTDAAVWKARHMAWQHYLAHDDPAPPISRTWAERLAACGYGWSAGENIASWYPTPDSVFDAWLGSADHRSNIESPNWTVTGAGVATSSGGTYYWSQTFGSYDDSGSVAPPPATYASIVLGSAPRAFWRLGESAGPAAADASGNGRTATYVNGVALGGAGAIPGNTAASFDGADDYVAAPNLALTGPFSLELWLYGRGYGTRGATSWDALLGYDYSHRLLWSPGDGRLLAQFDGNFFSTAPVWGQSWHHIVYTFDGGAERFYIDGAAAGAHATTKPVWNSPFRLGDFRSGTDYMLNGSLDKVAVYARALAPSEVLSHFKAR